MQVKETQNEGLKRGYQFTLPAADLAATVDAKLKEAQPEVEMKGFRKGKVPMAMLKKQHGPRLMGDALQEAIDTALTGHLETSGHRPAMQPKVEMAGGEGWSPGDDVVAMTEAAAATRRGEVRVAVEDAITWAGPCRADDVLGLADGEVVLVEPRTARG